MLEFEVSQSDGNESVQSLHNEYGEMEVPTMRTSGAKKALQRQIENYVAPPEKRMTSADSATTTI